MADVYKGLTIKFGAETSGLSQALKGIDRDSRSVQSELKKVQNALKFNPGNTELLRQKQELLAKQIHTTKQRLDALKQAEGKLGKEDVGTDAYNALKREIIETTSKLDNLEGKAKATNRELSSPVSVKNIEKLKDGAVKAGKAVGAIAAAGAVALGAVATQAIESADELQKLSDVTGLSAERLQELKFIGDDLGVELETLSGAQAKLTKTMSGAQDGGAKQQKAFKDLGVEYKNSDGSLRDANVVMQEAFDKLSQMKNGTERNALAQKLFGKSAKDLNPIIKAGGDKLKALADQARDSGAVMSNEAVAGLDTFGDTLDHLKNTVISTIGSQLAPAFEGLADKISTDFVPAFQSFVGFIADNSSWLVPFVGGLAGVAAAIAVIVGAYKAWQAIQIAWTVVTTVATAAQTALNFAMAMNPVGIIIIAIIALIAAIVLLWKKNEGFRKAVTGAWNAIKAAGVAVWGALVRGWNATVNGIKAAGGAIKSFFAKWGLLILAVLAPAIGIPLLIAKNWKGILATAKDIFGRVVAFVREQVDKLKRLFTNLVLKLPKIKLPHFVLRGSFSLKPLRVPTLGIDWYARGGSFAPGAPSLVGVGDQRRGYEHVLRDDQIVALMRRAMQGQGGQRPIQIVLNQPVSSYSETRRAMRDAAEELAW